MKNLGIYSCIFAACILSIGTTDVSAEKRLHAFEMGESGHTVVFEMSPEEIAEDNAAKIRREIINGNHRDKVKRWVEKIEFSESGVVLEFPLNAEEIQLLKISLEKAAEKRPLPFSKSDFISNDTEIVEMGDGHTLTFSTPTDNLDYCIIAKISR